MRRRRRTSLLVGSGHGQGFPVASARALIIDGDADKSSLECHHFCGVVLLLLLLLLLGIRCFERRRLCGGHILALL